VVGEILQTGINQTYSAADATGFDGLIVAAGAESLILNGASSTFFPTDRPLQLLVDSYRWGKPVGILGDANPVLKLAGINTTPGVYTGFNSTASGLGEFVSAFEGGLKTFKFLDRFPIDA